ncbi:MAG TPA: XRE family transcriptional regulator [Ramlibacter sp.]|nr:XRE family transcriptional regulator [Ramlibacter sp.]
METTTITPRQIGPRVRFAREAKNLTQDQVAAALGFNDRQTVSDIENGKRVLKAEELLELSDLLDRDVEFFVDPFSVVDEAQYSWRASQEVPKEALDRFEERAGAWVGLLRWMRESSPIEHDPLKFALRINTGSTYEAAQQNAERLVGRLGLGVVPADKLVQTIEQELDIPVLFVDMDPGGKGSISGAACHLGELGVILVNRREREGRRNFDLAHELFHHLTWEAMQPNHRESNSMEHRGRAHRIEQLADNFASALLMPRATLDAYIDKERLKDIAHLAAVAEKLRVAPEALSWRLLNLGLIDGGTRQALAQRRGAADNNLPRLFSERFVKLLHVALDKGRISARKAAKTLGLSLSELSGLFKSYDLSSPFEL